MKKSFILLIAIFLFIGCDDRVSISKEEYNKLINKTMPEYPKFIGRYGNDDYGPRLYIYLIDSCEYVGYLNFSDHDVLTHRGRCKFCIQRKINAQ